MYMHSVTCSVVIIKEYLRMSLLNQETIYSALIAGISASEIAQQLNFLKQDIRSI